MTRALLLLCLPVVLSAAEITGEWNLHLVRFGEEFAAARVELKADGPQVSGTLNELKLNGTVEGNRIRLIAVRPNGEEWGKFEGTLTGDGKVCATCRGTFVAVKEGHPAFHRW